MFSVVRHLEVPDSLRKKSAYDSPDVLEALNTVFFSKCYLCETKEPHDIHVEHFDAHQGDPNKKFEWTNLYLVCSRCNSIKGKNNNDLLDCCDVNTDVCRAIKHLPPATPYARNVRIEAMEDSIQAQKTTELLDRIYNSESTINKRISGSWLRKKVFNQYNLLLDQVNKYYDPIATKTEKELAIEKMKILIDGESPYSAFARWCILEDEKLEPLIANA